MIRGAWLSLSLICTSYCPGSSRVCGRAHSHSHLVQPIWELQQAQRQVRTAQRIRFDSRHAHERDSVLYKCIPVADSLYFLLAQAAALAGGRVGRLSARGSQGTHSSFKSAHPAFIAAHSLSSRLADVCAAECRGSPVCDASSLERKDIVGSNCDRLRTFS